MSAGRLVVAPLAVAVGLILGSCGFSGEGELEEIDDVPFGLDQTTTSTSTTTTTLPSSTTTSPDATIDPTTTLVATESVQVFWVIGFDDLVSQSLQFPSPVQPRQVLARLEEGPPDGPESVGLRSEVRPGLVRDVTVDRGVAVVDLEGDVLDDLSNVEGRAAVGQMVLSLRLPGIGQVSFTTDGEPESVPVPSRNNELSGPGEALAFEDFAVLLATSPPTATTTTTAPPPDTTGTSVPG
jgi:hypothetical protein